MRTRGAVEAVPRALGPIANPPFGARYSLLPNSEKCSLVKFTLFVVAVFVACELEFIVDEVDEDEVDENRLPISFFPSVHQHDTSFEYQQSNHQLSTMEDDMTNVEVTDQEVFETASTFIDDVRDGRIPLPNVPGTHYPSFIPLRLIISDPLSWVM